MEYVLHFLIGWLRILIVIDELYLDIFFYYK